MITEYYVSYEIAKMLKEKGFNERSIASYDSKGQLQEGYGYWNKTPIWCAAPTHQMAMKWLREEKNIIANVWYNGVDWNAEYYNNEDENFYLITDCLSNSYEAAVEAALKYCLENLI